MKDILSDLDAETVATVMAAGATLVTGVLQWWRGRAPGPDGPERFLTADGSTIKAQSALAALGVASGSKRSLVLEAVEIDGRWRSSVVLEAYDYRASEPVYDTWQDQAVDDDYAEMLFSVALRGKVRIVTDELDEGSALKSVYKSRAVAGSYVWLIKDTEDTKGRRVIVYGSLIFGDAIPAADEPGFLDAVRVATDSLKRALRIQD